MLLRQGVYPYEYMDAWERFDEKLLPDKEAFYSILNMEDITDVDYRHANRVFKAFKLNNIGDYHDLYVNTDTLQLSDTFENFRNMCIKVFELDPAHFLSAPGLAWKACLKKTKVELELITTVDRLLMIEKGIRGGICHAIHRYAKANNKYMIYYDEQRNIIYFIFRCKQCGWVMSQKLPVNGFKWVKNISKIVKDFIKKL